MNDTVTLQLTRAEFSMLRQGILAYQLNREACAKTARIIATDKQGRAVADAYDEEATAARKLYVKLAEK
jgi:hypothetical protein